MKDKVKNWVEKTFKDPGPESDIETTSSKSERPVQSQSQVKPAAVRTTRVEPKAKVYPDTRPSVQPAVKSKPSVYSSTANSASSFTANTPTIKPVERPAYTGNASSSIRDTKPSAKTSNATIKRLSPQSLEEAKIIIDYLHKGYAVLINLESNDKSLSQRIVDVVTGALYILDGAYSKVTDEIYLMAPKGVDIDSPIEGSSQKQSSQESPKQSKTSGFTFRR